MPVARWLNHEASAPKADPNISWEASFRACVLAGRMFHKCGGRVSPTKILGFPKPKGIGNWKFESKLCGDQRFARDPLHFDQRAEGTKPIAVTMVRSVKMTSDGFGA